MVICVFVFRRFVFVAILDTFPKLWFVVRIVLEELFFLGALETMMLCDKFLLQFILLLITRKRVYIIFLYYLLYNLIIVGVTLILV